MQSLQLNSIEGRPGLSVSFDVNVTSLKRVRALLGVNLVDLEQGDPPLMSQLLLDPILAADVLYALCKPQLDSAQWSDEDFGKALGGTVLQEGQDKLLQELTDFFQNLGRTEKVAMIRAQKKATGLAIGMAIQQIDNLDIQSSMSGGGSISSPESSDSTPDRSPSASSSGCPKANDGTTGTAPA